MLVSANAATRLFLTPVPLLSAVAVYQERQQEHITELTNTVQDLKLEIVRLKESLSAVQTVAKAKSNPPQRSYASVTNEGSTSYNGRRNGQLNPGANVNVVALVKARRPLKSLLLLLLQKEVRTK